MTLKCQKFIVSLLTYRIDSVLTCEVNYVEHKQTPVCEGANQGRHYAGTDSQNHGDFELSVFADPKGTRGLRFRTLKMVLVIPAQPATSNEERQAVLFSCFRDGSLLLDAKDGKKPARFYLKPNDLFPWDQFLPKLLVNWQLSDFKDIPREFCPQKRIPDFVLEGILKEPLETQLKILATLRAQGYFPALKTK